jgi:hypothetical protein
MMHLPSPSITVPLHDVPDPQSPPSDVATTNPIELHMSC